MTEKTGPDRAGLIEDPSNAMNVRIAMVREAAKTLDIAYYDIKDGQCADAFLGEVLLAADRGVTVRLVVDGKLLDGSTKTHMRALSAHENIECRTYNPLNLLAPWRLHSFLHDKFIIADNELLLLGGRNIDDRHFVPAGFDGHVTHDRDVFVWKTAGNSGIQSAVDHVTEYFVSLWDYKHTREVKPLKSARAAEKHAFLYSFASEFEAENDKFYICNVSDYKGQTVPTGKITLLANPIEASKKEPLVGHSLAQLAKQAERSVTVQTPYATASRELLSTLSDVSQTAQLTYVTNSALSSPNVVAFSNYYCQREKFLSTGAYIYEYQSTDSIHGKSVIIDERLSAVGSFNLDERSIYIDTETMLVIDSEEFAELLSGAVQSIRDGSLLVGADNEYVAEPMESVTAGRRFILRLVYMLLKPVQQLV